MLSRRGFLVGLGSLIAAPAIVRAASIMPVRRPVFISARPLLEEWAAILQRDEIVDVLFQDGDLIYNGCIIRTVPQSLYRDLFD